MKKPLRRVAQEKLAERIRGEVEQLNGLLKLAQSQGLFVRIRFSGFGSPEAVINENSKLMVYKIHIEDVL